ncbi:hypothetical protein [Sphingomonas sp.]|jgi:hypothetical protein|nr:hypothetical protein [Sphingomonas sp.]
MPQIKRQLLSGGDVQRLFARRDVKMKLGRLETGRFQQTIQ